MMAKERRPALRQETAQPFFQQLLAYLVAAGIAVIPLFMSKGYDAFRLPKELAYRAEAILVLALVLSGLLLRRREAFHPPRVDRRIAVLTAAIVVWMTVTTLISSNRLLSLSASAYAMTALIVFLGTYIAAVNRTIEWILLPVAIAAVPNAVLAVLQAATIWNPLTYTGILSAREQTTALLGNPNDVGSYLMLAALILTVGAVVTRRWVWAICAGVAAAGIVASGTLTAIFALIAGLFTLAFLASRRRAWISIAVVAALSAIVFAFVPLMRARLVTIENALREQNYPKLTSTRVYSIGPALLMVRDRPWTGVGPGAFKFNYLEYRREFDERHPEWYLSMGAAQNFGEVHCDHVQILAEAGVPAYVLFIGALVLLASFTLRASRSGDATTTRGAFVRMLALPLSVSFAFLALAAFPLELAAPTQLLLHVIAVIACWSSE